MTGTPLSPLVIREFDPLNLESPFDALDGPITPRESFYVRNHFAVPEIDANAWRLTIDGAVDRPIEMTLDELVRLPSVTRQATLECAGNGRVFLVPKKDGAQWALGAVGNAEWTGVPLTNVLERVGVKPSTVELLFVGADRGTPEKPSHPADPIQYARSLPLARATAGDVLLAYAMNGEALAPSHGFPVRLIVPAWYGMASVKWLTRIAALTQPFHGYFQGTDYGYWSEIEGVPTRVALTEMSIKSQIARPAPHEMIERGRPYRVTGAAWTGGGATVTTVEVSDEGGKTFAPATLLGAPVENAWRLWSYEWTAPKAAGPVTLCSRATDDRGRVQPAQHDKDYESYVIHHLLPVTVHVR